MIHPVSIVAHARRHPIVGDPAPSRQARFLRRIGLFGLEVATEALAASGIAGGDRVGLFSGVGGLRAHWDDMIGAFANQRDDGDRMWERGFKDVHPYWMLRHLSNNVHAIASVELQLRGEGATFGGGNGGAQAIASAARALADDAIDAALVVAYDSSLEPETIVEYTTREGRDFVPGEAAAALVLVRSHPGAPQIRARDAAGPGALERCRAGFEGETIYARPEQLGAATALIQVIDAIERGPGRYVAIATASPDLASAIEVRCTLGTPDGVPRARLSTGDT